MFAYGCPVTRVDVLELGFTNPSRKLPQPSAPSNDNSAKCGLHASMREWCCDVMIHTDTSRSEIASNMERL